MLKEIKRIETGQIQYSQMIGADEFDPQEELNRAILRVQEALNIRTSIGEKQDTFIQGFKVDNQQVILIPQNPHAPTYPTLRYFVFYSYTVVTVLKD